MEFAGVERFLDTPVKRYSSGMYVRIAFAVAAHLETEILLIDEVLAVGDAEFQRKCVGRMQDVANDGRTIVFVSHNLTAVERLCERSFWIRGGQVAADGQTQGVIGAYLKEVGGTQIGGTAQIAHSAPRVGGDNGRLTGVSLSDSRGNVNERLPVGEPVSVTLEFEVDKPIEGAVVELGLSSADGTRVVTLHNTDGGASAPNIAAGKAIVRTSIDVALLPGDFTIDVGLHDVAGATVDYVERALTFVVLNVGPIESRYPWATVRGSVRVPSTWSVESAQDLRVGAHR